MAKEKNDKKAIPISFRLPADEQYLLDFIENKELFKNTSEGIVKSIAFLASLSGYNHEELYDVKMMLDHLEYIRVMSLKEIAGKFNEKEWKLLVNSLKNHTVTGLWRFSIPGLIHHCQQTIDIHGLRNALPTDEFYSKLKSLTSAQVDAIYYYVSHYWEEPVSQSPVPSESDLRIIGKDINEVIF